MIIHTADELGATLRRARKDKRLTQQALADAMGVSRQWVIAAEAGAETVRLDLVLQALRVLDLALDVVPDEPDDALEIVLGRARG